MTINKVIAVPSDAWVNLHALVSLAPGDPLICQVKNHHNVNVIFVDSVLEPPTAIDDAAGIETNGSLNSVTTEPGDDEFTWARVRKGDIVNVSVEGNIPFDPLSIPNLELWLDAQDSSTIVLGIGTNVAEWDDKSGNAFNFTPPSPGFSPTFTTNAINSHDAVLFNGLISKLVHTFTGTVVGGLELSLYMVRQKTNSLIDDATSLSLGSATAASDFNTVEAVSINDGLMISPQLRYERNLLFNTISHPAIGTPFIYSTFFDEAENNSFLNGEAVDFTNPTVSTGTFNIGTMIIGSGRVLSSFARPYGGLIGEIMLFDRNLTDVEKLFLDVYFANKWSIF